MADSEKRSSSNRNRLSTLLFIAAAALLAFAAWQYWQDRNSNDVPPPPPSVPGRAELKNVYDVLTTEGLDVAYGQDGARIEDLTPAGQQLTVNGQDLFVFIFTDVAAREEQMASIDPESIELVDLFGDPITDETLHVYQQSNILAVLVGGDEELQQSVATAISQIP